MAAERIACFGTALAMQRERGLSSTAKRNPLDSSAAVLRTPSRALR